LFLFDSRLHAFGGQEAKRKRPAAGEAMNDPLKVEFENLRMV
jgi:hypothetical protein